MQKSFKKYRQDPFRLIIPGSSVKDQQIQISIIYQHFLVKMPLTFLISVLLYILNSSMTLSIGPQNYLSLNFGDLVSRKYDQNNIAIVLPCTANVGSCSFNFISYPLDWKVFPSGEIVLPKNYQNIRAFFAVKVQVSQPTGQSIDFNLIIESNQGKFTFQNANDFYNNLEYSPKPAELPKNSAPFKKKIPKGQKPVGPFPSYDQVTKTLASENYLKIAILLSTIFQTDADCLTKKTYYENLAIIIENQRAENAGKIFFKTQQIRKLEQALSKIQVEKEVVAEMLIQQKSKINQQQLLRLKNIMNENFNENLVDSIIATTYSQRLKQSSIIVEPSQIQKKSEEQILLEEEIESLNNTITEVNMKIGELFEEKKRLEREILERQYQIKIKQLVEVKPDDFDSLSEKYKQYALKAAEAKVRYQKAEFEIKKLLSDAQILENSLNAISKEIQELQKKLDAAKNSPASKQVADLKDVNQYLQTNQRGITKQIVSITCV